MDIASTDEDQDFVVEVLYILGSTRSGTSALRNAIALTRFKGHGEGHLAPLLEEIMFAVKEQKASGVGASVPGNGLFELNPGSLLRHLFLGYENYLAESIGSLSIIDKTPTIVPIRVASELNKFHSRPKFVHCARRHLDNIASKMKKFPSQDFVEQCWEWVHCNAAWLASRTQLNGNFLDFDFYDLTVHPSETVDRIGSYLELSEPETLLIRNYLKSQRPQTEQLDRDLTQFLKWSELDWTGEQKEQFISICMPLGQKLGYGLDCYFE